jgi:hypothetical protein
MKIQVYPLLAINEIKLGWSRTETYNCIGKPERIINKSEYYEIDDCFISVHYNSINKIEYIELSNPKNSKIEVMFKDLNLFNTKAENLISIIVEKFNFEFDKEDDEIPYSYIFNEIELSFWRPTLPETEFDENGLYFETIGIGDKGYYSKNTELR